MLDLDLDGLERLEGAATAGPVEVSDEFWITHKRIDSDGVERRYGVAGAFTRREDAVLYAATRNALPLLIAEIRRLHALEEKARELVNLDAEFRPSLPSEMSRAVVDLHNALEATDGSH